MPDDPNKTSKSTFPHPFALCDTQCMEPKRRQELLEQAVTMLWFHIPPPPTQNDAWVLRKLEDEVETHRFWSEVYTVVREHWGRGRSLAEVLASTRGK